MSVVVVGSLNMDIVMLVDQMPIIGETLLGEDVRYFYGGKGANQAVATSKMNVPVKMVANCQKTMRSSSYQEPIKKSPQKMSQNKS